MEIKPLSGAIMNKYLVLAGTILATSLIVVGFVYALIKWQRPYLFMSADEKCQTFTKKTEAVSLVEGVDSNGDRLYLCNYPRGWEIWKFDLNEDTVFLDGNGEFEAGIWTIRDLRDSKIEFDIDRIRNRCQQARVLVAVENSWVPLEGKTLGVSGVPDIGFHGGAFFCLGPRSTTLLNCLEPLGNGATRCKPVMFRTSGHAAF